MMKIDEIEFMQNFIVSLKKLGYSDWWIGEKTAVALRVLEIIEDDQSSDKTQSTNQTTRDDNAD